jgi:SNF2 family DNA or RNA helicase
MNSSFNQEIEQAEAFDKMSKLKAGALFMDMGTGKTKVALDLAISRQNHYDIVIWIAPASLINNSSYKDEILKWSSLLKKEIVYFSVESISMSEEKYINLFNTARNNKVFCIVDESITIKNNESGRTSRLLKMACHFDFRLILNGTPLSKGLIDLYSQIQFISPKILNMTETQFANNFLYYVKDGTKRSWQRWSKPCNEEALIETIRPYIFKADLDISVSIQYHSNCCTLSKEEEIYYNEEKYEFLKEKYEASFLEVAQKFQHIYTLCDDKREQVIKLVKSISTKKEKVIIYVKFLDEIEVYKQYFDFVELSGNKKDDLKIFEFKKNILITTYGSGSVGLNLQYANNIIFASQTFDYKDMIQAIHRVYRNGQVKNVNIFNMYCNTNLDNMIYKSINKKENVLNNVKKLISKEEAMKL